MTRHKRKKKYPNKRTLYIAYGSNLDMDRMLMRCPDALPVSRVSIPDKRLVFSGGVLNIVDDDDCSVQGGMYSVTPSDISALDKYEGYPWLYLKRWSHVTIDGERKSVFYYEMDSVYAESAPTSTYYATCLRGYRDWHIDIEPLRAACRHAIDVTKDHQQSWLGEYLRQKKNKRKYRDTRAARAAWKEEELDWYTHDDAGCDDPCGGQPWACGHCMERKVGLGTYAKYYDDEDRNTYAGMTSDDYCG